MISQETKALFGYLLLLASVIGFTIAFAASNYYVAVLSIVGGLLLWMIYLNIAHVEIHRPTGAILIIFGVLLSTAIFMAFGIEQDMWGGYRIKSDGAILTLIIFFFAVMPGLIFYYFQRRSRLARGAPLQTPPQAPQPEEPSQVQPSPRETSEEAYYPDWSNYDYFYDPELDESYYEDYENYYEGEEEEEEEE